MEAGTERLLGAIIMMFILEMRKLRHRDVIELGPGYIFTRCLGQALNWGL
jgi:hypothetical protein